MSVLEHILQEIDTIKVGVNTECRNKCKLYDWSVGACMGDCEIYVKEMAKDIIKKYLSDNDGWITVEERLPKCEQEVYILT